MRKLTLHKTLYLMMTFALSAPSTLMWYNIHSMMDLSEPLSIYISLIPLVLAGLIYLFTNTYMRKTRCGYASVAESASLTVIFGLLLSCVCYLTLLLYPNAYFSVKSQVVILLFGICAFSFSFALMHYRTTKLSMQQGSDNSTQDRTRSLFSLYYMNTPKVFEIAMLLDNKVKTHIEAEMSRENSSEKNESANLGINLNQLNEIVANLGFNSAVRSSLSEKTRFLENFDVKTTKSNLLEIIVEKGVSYSSLEDLHAGDLVLFEEAELELLNQREAMAVTKLLINGALNGSVINTSADDIQMSLNVSSIINSILKDYVYEFRCKIGKEEFFMTIPMTFENDFENNYNVYDLLVGKTTVVGVYKGAHSYEHEYDDVFGIIDALNGTQQTKPKLEYNNDESYSLTPSNTTTTNEPTVRSNGTSGHPNRHKPTNTIDVLAIIQKISL